ncbi:hypothetical protein D3C73_1342190 [compost metagenome]
MAGFKKSSRTTNTTGRKTRPPRDNVSRMDKAMGTSVNPCIACSHHFLDLVIANIATNKKAIKNAAYVFGYWNTEARRGPFASTQTA